MSALSNILGDISNVSRLTGAIRSLNIPAGAESIIDLKNAFTTFEGEASSNDWRVRLTLPKWPSFRNSPILQPLIEAGGLIFPYTPKLNIGSSASYNGIQTTHTNHTMQSFQRSEPDKIDITDAPMYVEDSTQALYWIAMVHYFRSMVKMFTGYDVKAGNPPPIVFFNAYGSYVFKNVPVVVTKFSVALDNTCDFIPCDVTGASMSDITNITDSVGVIGNIVGKYIPGVSGITNLARTVGDIAGQGQNILSLFKSTGTVNGGTAYVPTKSTFLVNLQPMYSRNAIKRFSLDQFVQGGYVNSSTGYI